MNYSIRNFLLIASLALLSACIAVPVQTADGGTEPFSRNRLDFIEVGKSTKQDVVTALPGPMQFLDGDLWLYWAARNEADWGAFVIFFTPSVIDGGLVPMTTGEIDYRFLVIRFDEYGVVESVKTSRSEERLGCNRSGVCGTGTTFSLLAPREQDLAVKNLDVPEDRCAVHVYGEPKTTIRISFDGEEVGELFGRQGFVFGLLDPGTRQLKVAGEHKGYKRLVRQLDFDCRSGSAVYIDVQTEKRRGFSKIIEIDVTEHDEVEGREALDRRKLVLYEDV